MNALKVPIHADYINATRSKLLLKVAQTWINEVAKKIENLIMTTPEAEHFSIVVPGQYKSLLNEIKESFLEKEFTATISVEDRGISLSITWPTIEVDEN